MRNEPCMVMWRSSENFAASASNVSPSWNFTPGRSLMVTALPSSEVSCESASCGTTSSFSFDVEQLVADRREHDAPHIGAGERRIEHVRILGEPDAQVGLRRRRSAAERDKRGSRRETQWSSW